MILKDFYINPFVFSNIKNFINNYYKNIPSSHKINSIEDITSIDLLSNSIIINGWAKVPYREFY